MPSKKIESDQIVLLTGSKNAIAMALSLIFPSFPRKHGSLEPFLRFTNTEVTERLDGHGKVIASACNAHYATIGISHQFTLADAGVFFCIEWKKPHWEIAILRPKGDNLEWMIKLLRAVRTVNEDIEVQYLAQDYALADILIHLETSAPAPKKRTRKAAAIA